MEDDPANQQPWKDDVNSSGVDRTLIRWMLSLTPRERLEALQSHAEATLRLMERAGYPGV